MIGPFVLLLGLIALAPLFFNTWWVRHYPKAALGLGAVTLTYYLAILGEPNPVLHTASEYTSFIALIGSLFVVSGGIHITVQGEATPRVNVVFLLLGAIIANVLGTTGASMLLIRPYIRMNKYRITAHHVVFFIFIVSNVGGCLTPIGDPPLFLGYLRGIPFWWVIQHCWSMWMVGIAALLALFYVVDRRNYLRAPRPVREELAEPADVWRIRGLHNLGFLALILFAVFLQHPPFLREFLMLGAAVGSYLTTRRELHRANDFNFHPIREVAILFAGIFATMIPALEFLRAHAAEFGAPTATTFFWGTGILSSFLDNAPTYLSFLSTELGAFATPELVQQVTEHLRVHGTQFSHLTGPESESLRATVEVLASWLGGQSGPVTATSNQIQVAILLGNPLAVRILTAISVAAVFFGANTYIGNGPNFMVKAIADDQRVNTPSFLGYVFRFTLPIMTPILLLTWWLFFRG
jgi:Na+/H+ antiporter NhaD/arsenite permease-like protein